jgi:hypothetical protein
MSAKPKPKPLTAGDFSVKTEWALKPNLDESTAWGLFLEEYRAGRFVKLLRGKIVVASSG